MRLSGSFAALVLVLVLIAPVASGDTLPQDQLGPSAPRKPTTPPTTSTPIKPRIYFGTYCQEKQDGASKVVNAQKYCDKLSNRLKSYHARRTFVHRYRKQLDSSTVKLAFTPNKDGSSSYYGLDTVHYAHIITHANAGLLRFKDGTHTMAQTWRFGNSSKKLYALSMYACMTLSGTMEAMWKHYAPTLKAGLYVILGATSKMWTGVPGYAGKHEDYADRLRTPRSFQSAWRGAVAARWPWRQDPAALAGGTTCSNCYHRLYNINIENAANFPRLDSKTLGCICRRTVDGTGYKK